MAGPLLVTTASEGLQPLGSAAQRSFELVTGTLRSRLGPDHAALFAEPVASEHGERIDWYAPIAGAARPLSALDDAQAAGLRDRLGRLVEEIRAEAEALAASGRAEDQRLAEALSNALEVPGEQMIWAVEGAGGTVPVLVHWAWIGAERRPVRGVLTAMVPRPGASVPDATSTGAANRAGTWWALIAAGWVVLALLLGAILWLQIAPCGLNPAGPDFCPGDGPATLAAMTEEQVISDDIASLERAVALAARTCQPRVPVTPASGPEPDRRGGLFIPGRYRPAPAPIPAIYRPAPISAQY
jgi:hypothetical protein